MVAAAVVGSAVVGGYMSSKASKSAAKTQANAASDASAVEHESDLAFGEAAARLHSFAYLPLHAGSETIGILVLASEDKQRFYPEMGTVLLQRIAEAAGAALHPHIAHE